MLLIKIKNKVSLLISNSNCCYNVRCGCITANLGCFFRESSTAQSNCNSSRQYFKNCYYEAYKNVVGIRESQ